MKVLISGYYGFGNVGDEAVLEAIIKGLKEKVPAAELTVLSAQPKITAELNRVGSIHRYDLIGLFKALDGADVFLSGGGSLFQDSTSSRSFWYYICLVWLAKLFGKKVMVFAQGFGPLRRGLNRLIARFVLNQVDLITLRDEDSLNELKRLGVKRAKMIVTADPTFLLKADLNEGKKLLALEGIPAGKPLLGVALRQFVRRLDGEKGLAAQLAATLDRLNEKYGWEPVFLLFRCPADMSAASKVMGLMKRPAHVVFKTCRPAEMLALFPHFEFVIGLRLHSLIFAAICGVPMLGLSYDPKVRAFMREIDQPCLELNETDRIDELMDNVILQREEIKSRLSSLKPRLINKAGENFKLFLEYFGKGV